MMVEFPTAYQTDDLEVPYAELEGGPYPPPPPQWSGTLCDCFANIFPTCACSFCCTAPYAAHLHAVQTNDRFNMHKTMTAMLGLLCVGYGVSAYSLAAGRALMLSSHVFLLCLANQVRRATRSEKRIPGSDCEDAVLSVACLPCSLAQTARTLTKPRAIFEPL